MPRLAAEDDQPRLAHDPLGLVVPHPLIGASKGMKPLAVLTIGASTLANSFLVSFAKSGLNFFIAFWSSITPLTSVGIFDLLCFILETLH
jgi:hypothetical protein